ncbi:MAG: methyltransferase domain-containing protein [Anaerolineales bacterium]|nr:methyltransferase domain-containing protein [Anaerolineales bacterium]MDP3183737.1 methyltransferase domain-containing protein [Anaerolineales bacterium]
MSFDASYFSTHTYKDVSFARYSQYWWSNRFYVILARRYGKRGARLLEIGSGLGHLVGQLEGHFETFAADVNPWALKQSLQVAGCTLHVLSSAEELPFADESFGVVISKHVVEHLPQPEKAIAELGRVTAPQGVLILSTPNLDSLLKLWKGKHWIGYQDPTHISLKPPAEWLALIRNADFSPQLVFADGFWDVPYIPVVPKAIQKLFFGSLGGLQAMTGFVFLPLKWGESMMVIARKT